MSMPDGDEHKREIIIVKRRGGDGEDGHHGGAWKIAFADFMTAMMCFFLVMWLVNATTEETKAAVASYFNPMRLSDPVPTQTPELEEAEGQNQESVEGKPGYENENPQGDRSTLSGPAQETNAADQSETKETSDQNLFADPFAVLAEIAAQTATLQNVSARGDGGAQTSGPATGAEGGESYRDPFAPDFWSEQIAIPALPDAEPLVLEDPTPPAPRAPALAEVPPVEDVVADPAEAPVEVAAAPPSEPAIEPAPEPMESPEAGIEPVEPVEDAVPETGENSEELAEELRANLAEAFGENSELNESISVEAVDKGILISLTDDLEYGMFQVGSAVPVGELVLAMEKVGAALEERLGKVSIKGHTDGRPFRGAEYDNWRLSTARAHSAYYMLLRGGLDETRIGEVAGYADRQLKNADDPFDGANRRIEILVEVEE